MKQLILIVLLILITTTAAAKIYKWIDENGTVHFSDKAYSEDAKEIKLREPDITVNPSAPKKAERQHLEPPKKSLKTKGLIAKDKQEEEDKVITEADYRIKSTVGKLGADVISISGRISSGPRCKNMTVTATAKNDNGLSGTITDQISKTNTYGSTIFEGNAKVSGSADDFGFWEVISVTVRCND